MTARNIAVISPMRQRFAALAKASDFAAAIIAKYSDTEPFPFNGETLIFFNALKNRLDEEKRLRTDIGYTLRLMIVRRLILEGRLTDPTVTKRFLPFVSERVERNLHYLRISDSSAYTKVSEVLSYIGGTVDLDESIITSVITEDLRSFRYTFVDMTALMQRFFDTHSESNSYPGNYIYNMLPGLVYRREEISGDSPFPADNYAENVSDHDETVINTAGSNYSYNSENLTYKTENETSESTDIRNEQNVRNISQISENNVSAPVTNFTSETTENRSETIVNAGDNNYSYNSENLTYKTENETSESTDIRNEQNVRNISQTFENNVSAPVTNITAETTENRSETVVNAGDNNYRYNSENLTYKTENETSESTDIRNEQNVRNISQTFENNVSAPVTNITAEITENHAETVVNAGDSNYRYNSENLTYKTENETSESTDIRNEQNVRNISQISENSVSAPVTNFTAETTENRAELIVNAGDSNYSYNSENLTYKTENETSESTDIRNEQNVRNISQTSEISVSAPVTNITSETTENRAETVVNAGDSNYSYNSENLTYKTENTAVIDRETASEKPALTENNPVDIGNIGLLVMNTFLSGGSGYLSSVREKYTHKRVTLIPATTGQGSVTRLLNSPVSSFGVIGNAIELLSADGNRMLSAYERDIYESAVTKVYLERHTKDGAAPREMLAGMSPAERTEVLSAVAERLLNGKTAADTAARAGNAPAMNDADKTRTFTGQISDNAVAAGNGMRLLRLLSGDKSSRIFDIIRESHISDTVSSQLNTLYFGIDRGYNDIGAAGAGVPEKTVYMPSLMKYIRLSGETNERYPERVPEREIYSTRRPEITGTRKNAGSSSSGEKRADMPALNVLIVSASHNDILRNNDNARTDYPAVRTAPVYRSGKDSLGIVRTVLERIAGYNKPARTPAERAGKSSRAVRSENGGARLPINESINTYGGTTINAAISEYDLHVTAGKGGTVYDNIRLLPVYTLGSAIMPVNILSSENMTGSRLHSASASYMRSVAAHRKPMNILRGGIVPGRNTGAGAHDTTAEADSATAAASPVMPRTETLLYREPVSAAAPAVQQPANGSQPDKAELIRQFGNLIEGADAGLTPSYDAGTRSIGEAMAAIEQTAEKVAVNSKLIEEIREKQRAIESVTLKSSDMDTISEEMIRRLRERMRFDRSRFL